MSKAEAAKADEPRMVMVDHDRLAQLAADKARLDLLENAYVLNTPYRGGTWGIVLSGKETVFGKTLREAADAALAQAPT